MKIAAYVGSAIAALIVFLSLPASGQSTDGNTGALVDTGAQWRTQHAEWCPGVAVTTLPTTKYLKPAKTMTLQNVHASTICYVTFDAQNPTTNGALGYKLAAGATATFDVVSATTLIQGACNVAMSTGGCIQVLTAR